MDMQLKMTTFTLLLLLASSVRAQISGVFDITKYGAAPNGDITQALTNAWHDACASITRSKIVIPGGTYNLKQIELKGPCMAPIEVQVDATIQAPQDPSQLNGNAQWIKFTYINFFTLSGGGTFDGQGAIAWNQNNCGKNKDCKKLSMNFGFGFLNNTIIRDITSKDSKNFHVNVLGCKNITFTNFNIIAPATSLNTDGIHIGRSTQVNITNANIATGDDCISLGDGSRKIGILNVTCGPGHGISVGSLGKYPNEEPVEGLVVRNCTLNNTANGLRIKTWPSSPVTITVTDMHFEDIKMINVMNPIIIDQEYCPWNQCTKQSPSKIKISKVTFKNIIGTSATKEGVALICSSGVPCEDIVLSDIDLTFNGSSAAAKLVNVKPITEGKSLPLLNLAQPGIFDLTKYGAVANGDITPVRSYGLTKAWTEACASKTQSKIVIPEGTYNLKQIELKGPCLAPIEVQVHGTIKAPEDPDQLDREAQWVKFTYLNFLTLSGGGIFDGQGAIAWSQNDCGTNQNCKKLSMNFGFGFLNNTIIQDITSKDSKNFHVNVLGCNNITFTNFNIIAPHNSLNTDGIHLAKSTLVNIFNSKIATGDDCVSVGDGSKQITISGVTCGPGHGISLGSLGKYANEEPVQGFTVKNCTLANTDNGLRIKTWPSAPGTITLSDMHFEDIMMINVMNPIIIDQEYCPWDQCSKESPSKIKISKVTYKNIIGTSATLEGVILLCSSAVPCEDVTLDNIDLKFHGASAVAKYVNVKPIIVGKTLPLTTLPTPKLT
ncbi:hypothetical protein CR513_32350, partial [Mucuna pruriens]